MKVKASPILLFALLAGDAAAAAAGGGDITFVARPAELELPRSPSPQQRSMSMTKKNVNRPGTGTPLDHSAGATAAVTTIPRGGGGDIVVTPTLVAKMVTLFASAQGLMMKLAPVRALEQYGVPNARASLPMTKLMTEAVASGILSYATLAYSLLVTQQTSLQTAVQFAYIPWFLWHLDSALNNCPKKDKKGGSMGTAVQNPQVAKIMVAAAALCMYTAGQDYGEKAMMIQAVIWGLSGLQMVLAPMAAAKSWQVDMSKFDDQHGVSTSVVGWSMIAFWTFVTSMIKFDASPIEAFGYGGIVWGTMHTTNVVLGKNKKGGVDDLPSWIWAFINFATSAYILSESVSA